MTSNWLPTGGLRSQGGDEIRYDCPQCGAADKFSYNIVSHRGRCWVCNIGVGSEQGLKVLFGGRGEVSSATPQLRRLADRGMYVPALESSEAFEYLQQRRVEQLHTLQCGALWNAWWRRVHFPIWSPFEGQPLMTIGRAIDKDVKVRWDTFPGNRSKYLFGRLPSRAGGGGDVVVTEGVFHVLSSGLWGRGLAILGKELTPSLIIWLLQQNYACIIVWLDHHEESGRLAQQTLIEQLCIFANLLHPKPVPYIYAVTHATVELGELTQAEVFAHLERKERFYPL